MCPRHLLRTGLDGRAAIQVHSSLLPANAVSFVAPPPALQVRTDRTYPVGFMDVVDIPKTGGCTWMQGPAAVGRLAAQVVWVAPRTAHSAAVVCVVHSLHARRLVCC